MRIKRLFLMGILVLLLLPAVGGCQTQSTKVSHNLSLEADNFNVVRHLTVIDCITGDVLFQMTGKISIYADTVDDQLEITVEGQSPHA